MQTYRLAPGVYARASDEGAVFLDLSKDEYLGVGPDESSALALVVQGWPRAARRDARTQPSPGEAGELAQNLCERGILTADVRARVCQSRAVAAEPQAIGMERRARSSDSPATPECSLAADEAVVAEAELIPWPEMEWRHIRLSHVLRFAHALATGLLLLRFWRFQDVVERVRRRKLDRRARDNALFDPLIASALISAFYHIRAFVYGPKGRCLIDSLTLIEFLSYYDQYPDWVIGVQVTPFGSHSWVQHGTYVLNGSAAYVRAYDAILVI